VKVKIKCDAYICPECLATFLFLDGHEAKRRRIVCCTTGCLNHEIVILEPVFHAPLFEAKPDPATAMPKPDLAALKAEAVDPTKDAGFAVSGRRR
jgi:hypothetical protein